MIHALSLLFFVLLAASAGIVIWNGMKGSSRMILRALGIEPPSEILPLPPRPDRQVMAARIVRRSSMPQPGLRAAA